MCLGLQLDARVASRRGGDCDVVFPAAVPTAAANINKPIDVLLTHQNEATGKAVRHIATLPGRTHACPGVCRRVSADAGGSRRVLARLSVCWSAFIPAGAGANCNLCTQ